MYQRMHPPKSGIYVLVELYNLTNKCVEGQFDFLNTFNENLKV